MVVFSRIIDNNSDAVIEFIEDQYGDILCTSEYLQKICMIQFKINKGICFLSKQIHLLNFFRYKFRILKNKITVSFLIQAINTTQNILK